MAAILLLDFSDFSEPDLPVLVDLLQSPDPAYGRSAELLRTHPISFHLAPREPGEAKYFLARSARWQVELGPAEFSLRAGGAPIRFKLASADPKATIVGEEPLPGRVNYILGAEPNDWQTGIQSYERVRYQGILPGIDLVFYGQDREIEYDFQVSPAADPDQIKLQIDHAWTLLETGDLLVETKSGPLSVRKPTAYQDTEEGRQRVDARFQDRGDGFLAFELGDYEKSRALVIDPVLEVSSYLGGADSDVASDVAVDSQGNLFLLGSTQSMNFPTSGGAFAAAISGGADLFVTKLSPSGQIIFSTFIGGSGEETPTTLALGSGGNVYLTGATSSQDFPVRNAFQTGIAGGQTDAFVLALNAAGTDLVYSTLLGGRREEAANQIRLDAQGAALVAGFTNSTDFPVTAGVRQGQFGGGSSDAFLAKISPNGSQLIFSTFLGGNRQDAARVLGLDSDGNIVLVGSTDSTNFPTVDAIQGQRSGNSTDLFVSKFDSGGTALLFSTYLGGQFNEQVFGGFLDEEGDIYFVGDTSSLDFPVVFPVQDASAGGLEAFVTRMKSDGTELVFSTYLGGSGADSARAAAPDQQGNIWVTGATLSVNFPTRGTLTAGPDNVDAFLLALPATGSHLLSSTYLGGEGTEIPEAMTVDSTGNAFIVGSVDQPGLPLFNSFQDRFGGVGVFRSNNAAASWTTSGEGLANPNILSLALDSSNSSIVYAGSNQGAFKSTDGGMNWTDSGLENQQVLSIVVDAQNALIYAGTNSGLFQSDDAGESWTAQTRFVPFSSFPTLVIDPVQSSTVYAGSSGRGVFKTTDRGMTWRPVNNGLRDSGQLISSLVVDPSNRRRLYAATPGTIYLSQNGGATWQKTAANLEAFTALGTLRIDPRNAGTLFVSGTSSTNAIPDQFCSFDPPCNNFVLRSTDGGVNYDVFSVGGRVTDLVIDPQNSSVLYSATSASGIFKSTDGGETWVESNSGLGTLKVNALAISRQNSRLLAATPSGSDGFLMKVQPAQVSYLAQIGQGQTGTIRFQTTVILFNTGQETTALIEFFGSDGQPLELTLGSLGTSSSFEIPLGKGQAFSAQTPGQGTARAGYARITTSSAVGGTAVFTQSDVSTGVILSEVGVPASPAISAPSVLFVDSLGDRDTGLALVAAHPESLGPAETTIQLDLFDRDGLQLDAAEWAFGQGEHRARFVSEIFPEIGEQVSEMRGTLFLQPSRPYVALTLRRNSDPDRQFPMTVPSLTSLPVVSSAQSATELYLPQIADGQVVIPPGVVAQDSFKTGFLFLNTASFPAAVTLELFDLAGDPLSLTIGDLGSNSVFQIQVPRGYFFAETPGTRSLQIGYARITSNRTGLGAAAIFAQTSLATNIVLYEAGVPAVQPYREFTLFVDTLGTRNTGLALANTDTENDAIITFRLYDKGFNLIGTREITLVAGGHLSRFVTELFPQQGAQLAEFEGVVTVESTQPLAAVTLRQDADVNKVFPADVPTLASFPVVPGRAQ